MADRRDEQARAEADRLMAAVVSSTGGEKAQPGDALPERAKVHRIPAPGADVGAVATTLARWYEQKRMHVQVLQQGAVYTVQTRSPAWRRAVGMAVALTVVLHREGTDLVVEMGSAPWAERAAFAAVGTQLPVLLATAAWGQWEQTRLPEQSLQYIRSVLPASTGPDARREGGGAVRRRMTEGWQRGAARFREAVAANAPGAQAEPTGQAAPATQAAAAEASSAAQAAPTAEQPAPPRHDAIIGGRLDVNTATQAELAALPGIDAETVAAVLRARAARGGTFASRAEFERATGIKPHVVVRLRELVEVGPTRPARPPRAAGRVVDL